MNSIFTVFASIIFMVGVSQADVQNVFHWKQNGLYYYYFSESKMDAQDVQDYCEYYGANLVSISSQEEQDFLNNNTESTGYYIGLVIPEGENGCNSCKNGEDTECTACRNRWKWIDGSDYIYENWLDNQPDNAGKKCARIQFNGKWKVAGCHVGKNDNGYRYICKRKNHCLESTCGHGTCEILLTPDKYICHCDQGYTGHDCTHDVDECENTNLCVNGATCENFPGAFSCQCVEGYTGLRCELDINECESQPCQNGGTCIDQLNTYSCNCTDETMDEDCAIDATSANDLTALWIALIVSVTMFGVSFIVMIVMAILDIRDVMEQKHLQAEQKRCQNTRHSPDD